MTGAARVGIWHAVAMTYDGATAKLYVNGALKVLQAAAGTVQGAGSAIVLGGYGFKGILDEFLVTPRALSASEVQEQFSVLPNLLPYQPVTPQPTDGRTLGVAGTPYTFQFMSWDLDGDPIKYRIDWGDGTPHQDTSSSPSGVLVTATHSWTTAGTHNVKVQAIQTVSGVEKGSAWSPTYGFNVSAGGGAKLEGFLLIGPTGNAASSASKRVTMTIGEPVVIPMASANYGIALGYQDAATSPSSISPLTLGATGPGGQETLPPDRPSMTATLSLAGSTSLDVNQIAQSLRQNPAAQIRDANGNYRISNGKWIKYDSENRPIRIITGEGTKAEMTYDYTGQRVKRVVTSADGRVVKRTVYVGTIYEENDGIGTNYIHANNQRIAMKTGSTVYYFHQDRLGSASLVTNSTGSVVRTVEYTPFGSTWKTSGGFKDDRNYTGQIFDDSTGLYYYNARYYDPSLGRFLTPDIYVQSPYDPQTQNRYAYCRNNPISYSDPSGNFFWVPVAIGVMAGAYTGSRIADSRGYNPWTWRGFGYVAAGAAIGGLSGAAGANAAASGGFMANTMGMVGGSLSYSAGMAVVSGGMMQPSVAYGFGSYNFGSGKGSYMFDGDNKWYEDAAYTVGALANLQDVTAGFAGTNVTVNSASTKKPNEWWGHSSITNDSESINISVGPVNPGKSGAWNIGPGKLWDNYANQASTWKVPLYNVNSKILTQLTSNIAGRDGLMFGGLNWNLAGFSCVNHTSRALWLSGVPTLPINFHPLMLNTQLAIRQVSVYGYPYVLIRK